MEAAEVLIVYDPKIQSWIIAVMRCYSSHRCSPSRPGHNKTVFGYPGRAVFPKTTKERKKKTQFKKLTNLIGLDFLKSKNAKQKSELQSRHSSAFTQQATYTCNPFKAN